MAGELNASQIGIGTGPRASVGYIYQENGQISVSGDIYTINGRTYELHAAGPTGSDVDVVVPDGSNPAVVGAALVAAINNDGSRTVDALLLSTDIVGLISLTDLAPTLSETANKGEVSGAAMVGNEDGDGSLIYGTYEITAADVTALAFGVQDGSIPILGVRSTVEPLLMSMIVDDGGVQKSIGDLLDTAQSVPAVTLTWTQFNTNFYALVLDEGASTELNAGDKFNFIVRVL